jgi:regulator of RNase E activity RraA
MGLYVTRRDAALTLKRRIGDSPYLLELPPTESIDVNFPEDFELAELVASGIRRKERKLFDNIKNLLSSPVLSDVLDEMGVKGVLSSNFMLNLTDVKVFGRAKTLQIDVCREDERYEKIYEGLNHYDYIGPGDLVVVANNVPEFAYFGGLNANLAIRSGAAGAIIDGVTRDSFDTVALGFPVFSKGNYCKDVKKRGVVRSFNKGIKVDGVWIRKDDLIFGDRDGVVVIPQEIEEEALKRAIEVRNSEFLMLSDIARGMHVEELIDKYGCF